jgi:hypothetical protein
MINRGRTGSNSECALIQRHGKPPWPSANTRQCYRPEWLPLGFRNGPARGECSFYPSFVLCILDFSLSGRLRTVTFRSAVKKQIPNSKPKGAAVKGERSAAAKSKGPLGAGKPAVLAGGNPRIAKADGDAPVQDYIAAMPGWKRDIGRRLDALIVRIVPKVRKAVRWNSPFYGIEGQGWFLAMHVFTHYVKVTFFRGKSLRPIPPGGTGEDARWIDIHEDDLDEAQMATWVKQAAAIPGWGKS